MVWLVFAYRITRQILHPLKPKNSITILFPFMAGFRVSTWYAPWIYLIWRLVRVWLAFLTQNTRNVNIHNAYTHIDSRAKRVRRCEVSHRMVWMTECISSEQIAIEFYMKVYNKIKSRRSIIKKWLSERRR